MWGAEALPETGEETFQVYRVEPLNMGSPGATRGVLCGRRRARQIPRALQPLHFSRYRSPAAQVGVCRQCTPAAESLRGKLRQAHPESFLDFLLSPYSGQWKPLIWCFVFLLLLFPLFLSITHIKANTITHMYTHAA